MMNAKAKDIDGYIAHQPKERRVILEKVRKTIKKAAPHSREVISYNMPGFRQNKVLVYFAGCNTHLGFYPMPAAIKKFKTQLANYQTSKGAVQFPWDKPMPLSLITKIVKFRVKEDKKKDKNY